VAIEKSLDRRRVAWLWFFVESEWLESRRDEAPQNGAADHRAAARDVNP
jgi:hypothetical protein